MTRCILLAGLLFNLAACHLGTDSSQSEADTTASEVGAAAAAGEMDTTRVVPLLALDPEGLRFVDPSSGSTNLLTFGMDGEEVIAAVTMLRGEPADRGVDTECGEGPLTFATWPDGLTLNSSEGRFSGWGVHGNAAGADQNTTMSGIGVGSIRSEVEDKYVIRTGQTSLGTEFAAGDMHGVLAGAGSEAEVTSLWSGTACIFR